MENLLAVTYENMRDLIQTPTETVEIVNPDLELLKQAAVPLLLIVVCFVLYLIRRSKAKNLKIKVTIIPAIILAILAISTIAYDYWWTDHYLNITSCSCPESAESREVYRTYGAGPATIAKCACVPVAPSDDATRYRVDTIATVVVLILIAINAVQLSRLSSPKKPKRELSKR